MIRNHASTGRMADAWKMLASAGRAAEAVRNGRMPAASDLERLGISASAFVAIRRI